MAYALEQDNYRSKRSYLATTAFDTAFFTYTTSLNPSTLQQEGKLSPVILNGQALTSAQCPAGRVLRENGRKLYPGVNPGLAVGDSYQGTVFGTTATNHFFVGVFDAVTGAKGFINPNISTFVVYNSDKSLEVVDQDETNQTGVNKNLVVPGSLTAVGQIRSSTSTVIGTTSPQSINGTLGQVFTLAQASGVAMTINCGTVPPSGSVVYIVITPAGTAATITWGTNIKGLNVTPTAAKVTTCAFVSDGTNLNQFGAITST